MIHSFLGTGLRCPKCDLELVSDIEAARGTILREVLSCSCGYEEPVVQPKWTVEDVRRRIAIVRRGAA